MRSIRRTTSMRPPRSSLGRRGFLAWVAASALIVIGCGKVPAVVECDPGEGVTPVCGFENPEDLVALPGGEWLVVSQFPKHFGSPGSRGTLVAFRPADEARRALFPAEGGVPPRRMPGIGAADCPGPPDPDRFAPHGIDLAEGPGGVPRLLVVNHGGREAVEIFALGIETAGPRVAWQGCVPLPEDALANDVAALPDGAFAVSWFLPRDLGLVTMLRLALGLSTGRVLVFEPESGWQAIPGSDASAPNGIEASPDGGTLYFAAWGDNGLVRIGRDGSGRRDVALDFHPDNLTWASDGRLLVAGQRASLFEARACEKIEAGTCALPIEVVAVDPESLTVERLFVHDPATLGGAASVALEHRGALWVGTFSGDRLLRVPLRGS